MNIFQSIIDKADKEAQEFVSDLRRRSEHIEANLTDDWESEAFIKGTAQLKFLQQCITIIVSQQNLSVQLTDAIARREEWSIDKELELERLKLTNAFLLRLCTKLKRSKILTPSVDNL